MIPILYEKDEVAFTSNGLGRLRECLSCVVTEERNGIYECDFELPVTSSDYKDVQIGRIIGVTHDDSDDIQPFDIVSYTKPIDGIVTFHAVHISYRQSYMTVTGSNINSLSDAFTLLGTAEPSNPFIYNTDKTSSGFLASADGIPRTVRQMLGGIEGSILDTYGGEYEWDKWNVILHSSRGINRDFSIRYGVNMTEYNDELDNLGPYSSCIPYWQNGDVTVVGNRVDLNDQTLTGRGECVPLDLTDKFENQPTTAELETAAASYMSSNQTYLPAQTINVSFARLQDMGEYTELENLYKCGLCDTINVVFPDYDTKGAFKIVKTEWNVLMDRYESMELGSLSVTLSEALGLENTLDRSTTAMDFGIEDYITEKGTSGNWRYVKYHSGRIEAWYTGSFSSTFTSSNFGGYRGDKVTVSIPNWGQTSILFMTADAITPNTGYMTLSTRSTSSMDLYPYNRTSVSTSTSCPLYIHLVMTA